MCKSKDAVIASYHWAVLHTPVDTRAIYYVSSLLPLFVSRTFRYGREQQVVTFAHASNLLGSTCWREIVMAESRSEALSRREIFLHTQSTTDMSYRLDTLAKPC